MPTPVITFDGEMYHRNYNLANSIGAVKGYFGNFGVLVRAYSYTLMMGKELKRASGDAILNANYVKENLKGAFDLPYDVPCMHEFVLSGERQKEKGISTLNMAKRMMDSEVHPPAIYFPLIVHEAMMIEPTETETKQRLDEFIATMLQIAKEVDENPQIILSAPNNAPIKKVDETLAARKPDLNFRLDKDNE